MSLVPPAPPGWNYNPPSWSQRLPIAGVALVGFGIAAYLTAFQIGVIERVWEPAFGSGSDTALTSEVSSILCRYQPGRLAQPAIFWTPLRQ